MAINEENFLRIIATSSPFELSFINEYYRRFTGKGILEEIENNFSGNIKNLLFTVIVSNIDR